MAKIDYNQKFEELPESVQDALFSPSIAETIYNIGKSNNLTDEKISLLAELVGDIIMGLVKDTKLVNELRNLGLNEASTNSIAKNLLDTVVNPIRALYLKPEQAATQEEQEEDQLRPQFAQPPTLTQNSPEQKVAKNPPRETPFILHQEEEVKLEAEPEIQQGIPRPTFYKPAFREEYNRGVAPVAARLELGNEEEEKSKEPQTARTERPQVRVVHYSDLRTSVSPFGSAENAVPKVESREEDLEQPSALPAKPQGAPKGEEIKTSFHPDNIINLKKENNNEATAKSDVHPNNVINLKDLPL